MNIISGVFYTEDDICQVCEQTVVVAPAIHTPWGKKRTNVVSFGLQRNSQ